MGSEHEELGLGYSTLFKEMSFKPLDTYVNIPCILYLERYNWFQGDPKERHVLVLPFGWPSFPIVFTQATKVKVSLVLEPCTVYF